MTSSCLITGATGFVGNAVLQEYSNSVVLGRSCPLGFGGKYIHSELSGTTNYSGCFDSVETIIHCAARVHVMKDKSEDPLQAFREVNVEATFNLAKQAAKEGVKRFVYISSIKVNGESTQNGAKYTPFDQPAPEDPYGLSKFEAEQKLIKLSQETGMELVIIRPTLVYGVGVKGNFLNLLKLCKYGIPLPFGSIHNARSMVSLENLVGLIITCIDHPNAVGKIFLAADGDDVSLSRLLGLICKCMNKPVFLLPVPISLFKWLGKLMNKTAVVDRLLGDLQVDITDTKELLGWVPPYTVEQGIQSTVDYFMKGNK